MVVLEIPLLGDTTASFGAGQMLFSLKGGGGAVDDEDELAVIEAVVLGLLFCDFFLVPIFDDCPMVGELVGGCIASGVGIVAARAESDEGVA